MDKEETVVEEEVLEDNDNSHELQGQEGDDFNSEDGHSSGDDSQNQSGDSEGEDSSILKEQLRIAQEKSERYRAERDRLKNAKTKLLDKEEKETKQTKPELDVIRLEARGYTNQEEQEEILRAAKSLGVTPIEAAEDEFVLQKIQRMRAAKRAATSVDRPSNGSPLMSKNVDYYIRKGEIPKDKKMLEEVQVELARRSREGA